MAKLIQCAVCEEPVSSGADKCPHCGEPVPRSWFRYEPTPTSTYFLGCLVIIGLLLIFLFCFGGGGLVGL